MFKSLFGKSSGPGLLDRLKAMNCGVEIGAFRWVTSSDPKVPAGPPFRTIVDHGIKTGIHGDGVHIAPLNPWSHIQYAVTGINSFGDQVNPGQHLTRQEALWLATAANKWFIEEDDLGSIEVGKLADLVLWSPAFFGVKPDLVLKLGTIAAAPMGDPNASIPTPQPVH